MMKKTLTICLGLALILTLCGTFAGALASEVENGIDAIEDAMMKGNTNSVHLNIRSVARGDVISTPYSVLFHEYGHMTDYLIARSGGYGRYSAY